MLGDYNINYDNAMLSQVTADYINLIASLCCIQLIDKPTRISQTSNTVIDHIYVNSSLLIRVFLFIFYEDISDHLPICVEIRCKPNKATARRPHTRKITQENGDLFLKDLSKQFSTPEMRNTKNINKFVTLVSNLTNLYFPLKRLSRKQFRITKET